MEEMIKLTLTASEALLIETALYDRSKELEKDKKRFPDYLDYFKYELVKTFKLLEKISDARIHNKENKKL